MDDVTPEGAHGAGRRALLKGGLLSAGIAVASLTAQSFRVDAQATTRPLPPLRSQKYWWQCIQCDGLFFGANSSQGTCWGAWPSTGPHKSAGNTPFWVPYGNPSYPGLQADWRWCRQCQLLFWGPNRAESA